jgi:RNA polymerase sigma factor (sigma-70 family)
MTRDPTARSLRDVRSLFGGGTLAGLGEGELLDRFLSRRDEVAFEELLNRHGAMVLGVCRRWLMHTDDIDDAFQATFLILIRKASSLRNRDLLGPWLHGVAYRVAVRARAHSARRNAIHPLPLTVEPSTCDVPGRLEQLELQCALDEEITRLPEKHRRAVILCFLEGRTHEDAARELGWPLGTVKSRLAWARDRLRDRLARRAGSRRPRRWRRWASVRKPRRPLSRETSWQRQSRPLWRS